MAIGKAKTEWERLYPSTKRGKYNRSRLKKEAITIVETVMQTQTHQGVSGFVKNNHKILGIAEITLYRKVQLYNAIKNKVFDEKTVELFRNEKITYSRLLNKLRKLENERKIRNKTFSPPIKQKKIIVEGSLLNSSPEEVNQGNRINRE